MLRLALTALISIPLSLQAQDTWVVDAAGGAGHQFRTLNAAVNRAAPGDRILIRSGQYTLPDTGKALTFVGEGNPKIDTGLSGATMTAAGSLPMVFRDLTFTGSRFTFVLQDIEHVLIEDVKFDIPEYTYTFIAHRCGHLTLRNVQSPAQTVATDSQVSFEGCTFRCVYRQTQRDWAINQLLQSTVSITDTVIEGALPLRAAASTVFLHRGSVLRSIHPTEGHAISANDGTIFLDPAATLAPVGSGMAIFDAKRVVRRPLSSLRAAQPATLGQPFTFALRGQSGQNYAMLLGLPENGPTLPDQEPIQVSLVASFLIGAGTIPAAGTVATTRTVPNLPELRYGMLNIQGATSGPGLFNITNTLSVAPK